MLSRYLRWQFGLALILALASAGCKKGPARAEAGEVPVTGVVTLDGKPLAGAEVTFTCNTTTGVFSGATDENGKYQLWSNFGSTAKLEGPCTVKISKMELPPGVEKPPADMPVSPQMLGAKESLPPKYSDGGKTELTASVPAEGGTFNFELKSK